jgi:hypothetical protein
MYTVVYNYSHILNAISMRHLFGIEATPIENDSFGQS